MTEQLSYRVVVAHDAEHGVWYVADTDVPGLNAEAGDFDSLLDIVTDLVPDLVDQRGSVGDGRDISLCVQHLVSVKRLTAA